MSNSTSSKTLPAVTAEELLLLLSGSRLLPDNVIERVRRSLANSNISGLELARQLVHEGLITTFQAKQLLGRHYRGFFIGEKYKILDFLGKGGMSRVLLCEHLLLHRLVAVKLMNDAFESMPGAVERFFREARAAAAVDHVNVARIFDVDQSAYGPYLVMEFVDGTNLHDLTANHGPLGIHRSANYVMQAAAGLQKAHEVGLVHRDVKPDNMMLDRAGVVKILDLGLAKFYDGNKNENLTQEFDPKTVLGTADYIAPEQVLNSSDADIRADIYSLGCTLYFMLARRRPAGNGSTMEKLMWHQMKEADPIQKLRPQVPTELAAVIEKMMRKRPEDRYQTPAEVVEALAPWGQPAAEKPADHEFARGPVNYRLGLCPPENAQLAPPPTSSTKSETTRGSAGKTAHSIIRIRSGSGSHPSRRQPLVHDEPQPAPSYLPDAESDRPQRAISMAADPAPLFEALPTPSEPAPAVVEKPKRLGPWLLVGAMVGALLVGGGGVYLATRGSNSGSSPSVAGTPAPSTTANTSNADRTATPTAGVNNSVASVSGNSATPVALTTENAVAEPPRSGVVLKGGGSSAIKPMMEHWTKLYEKESGVRIEYVSSGSSKGVAGVSDRFLEFGCSDAPMTDKQLEAAGGPMLHIPLAMGAVVPTFNLVDAQGQPLQLRFTGPLLANIFLGRVTKWNDGGLAANNPGVDLPDLEITVVYRKDGSGTSAVWTDYLSKVSGAWKESVGSSSQPKFPIGMGADKNDGVANVVSNTKGAIGYVELSYALAHSLPVGAVKNLSGEFITPGIENITAAATGALKEIPDNFRYSLTNAPGSASYPIVGTTWAIIYAEQPGEKGAEVVKFLRWAVSEAGQKHAPSLKYGRLPPELAKRVLEAIDKVR